MEKIVEVLVISFLFKPAKFWDSGRPTRNCRKINTYQAEGSCDLECGRGINALSVCESAREILGRTREDERQKERGNERGRTIERE